MAKNRNSAGAFLAPPSSSLFLPSVPSVASQRGIALLIVVSVLTVIGIIGVSFVFSMFLETQASAQFSSTVQARYVSEAGIQHAWALLEEDRLGSRIDASTEEWTTRMAGSEADVDAAGGPESRWFTVHDAAGQPAGRYGVRISDEAGKINLNTAVADPTASGVDAADLTLVLTQADVDHPAQVAAAIETYRYGCDPLKGGDGKPGVAGVDDDRDGKVDEPDEYQVWALRGDDCRFERLEEIVGLGGLREEELTKLRPSATVYSWDPNVSLTGQSRLNINTATAEVLLGALLDTGVEHPWELAANMADYADDDQVMSRVNKMAVSYQVPDPHTLSQAGEWTWTLGAPNHYLAEGPGDPLVWMVTDVPPGTFVVLVRGLSGMMVGDVTIAGQKKQALTSGASFGEVMLGGSFTVEVAPVSETTCAFSGVELVAREGVPGVPIVPVRGVEAVRINEVMVSPRVALLVAQAVFKKEEQGSGWTCTDPNHPDLCVNVNEGSGSATWTWTSSTVPEGDYYVEMYGQAGSPVGTVGVAGESSHTLLYDHDRHGSTLHVAGNHEVAITMTKAKDDPTCLFQKIVLSLEPDAEYVELINLSSAEVKIGNWTLEGPATGGKPAMFPSDSVIGAHQVLVAAVDAEDTQPSNQIGARQAWAIPSDIDVVQLEFPHGTGTDWLLAATPEAHGELILKTDAGEVVDEVQYAHALPTPAPLQSVEKGDPTVIVDLDADGIDEGWYASKLSYTPGAKNYNDGLIEIEGDQIIVHDPLAEVSVLNRPLESVGELAGLSSGTAWQAVASADVAKVVDRLTVQGVRLEASAAEEEGAWDQEEEYDSASRGGSGAWRWNSVPDGAYLLTLYAQPGEILSVRVPGDDDWPMPPTADPQGRISVGQVTVVDQTLTLELRCESAGCHFSHVVLDPQLMLSGLININTASKAVLMSLPGITTDEVAQRIISRRPYGEQGGLKQGIGDLLLGSVLGVEEDDKLELFRGLAHLVTVRSSVFQVMSLGEAIEHDRPTASQRITAVIQR